MAGVTPDLRLPS